MTEGFTQAVESVKKDLAELTHDDLDRSWGSSSRRAYDVVYELGLINRRIAHRLRGEEPGPMPWKFGEEWLQAPEEMRDKASVAELFDATANEVLDAALDSTDEPYVIEMLSFLTAHAMYHDGQLNFIQSMKGDMAVHW